MSMKTVNRTETKFVCERRLSELCICYNSFQFIANPRILFGFDNYPARLLSFIVFSTQKSDCISSDSH